MRVREMSETIKAYSGFIWAVAAVLVAAWCLWMTVTVHQMAVAQGKDGVKLNELVKQNKEFRSRIDIELRDHEQRLRTVEIYSNSRQHP